MYTVCVYERKRNGLSANVIQFNLSHTPYNQIRTYAPDVLDFIGIVYASRDAIKVIHAYKLKSFLFCSVIHKLNKVIFTINFVAYQMEYALQHTAHTHTRTKCCLISAIIWTILLTYQIII